MAWYSIPDKQLGRILRSFIVIVPLLALLSTCSYVTATQANNRAAPDVQREVTINNNLRFFATNFLGVWFDGSDRIDVEQLESMVTSGVPVELPTQPMSADYINIADVKTLASEGNLGLYQVTANVTLTAPGSQTMTRNAYTLEVVRSDSSYAVAKLPELKPYSTSQVTSSTKLVAEMSPSSALGEAITNFVGSYYVSSNASSLGRFVTSDFKGEPIVDSPYTAVLVERIQASRSLEGQGEPEAGENEAVLVTFKGIVTNSTFNLMQVLLNVQLRDGKWVVDGISKRVPIENVKTQDELGPTKANPIDEGGMPQLETTRPAAKPSATPFPSASTSPKDSSGGDTVR